MEWMCLYLSTRRFLILFTIYSDILIYHGGISKYTNILRMKDAFLVVYFSVFKITQWKKKGAMSMINGAYTGQYQCKV